MDDIEKVKNTIFMTITGSHAYGINVDGSDVDVKGACIPRDIKEYFGFPGPHFEQYIKQSEEEDVTIYEFRKAVHLMALNNPNMIELIFMPDKFWLLATRAWVSLLEHRELFLSRQVRQTYGGYAHAQLKRIRHHRGFILNPPKKKPERSDFGLQEKRHVSNDELQQFLWFLSRMMKDTVEMTNLSHETKEELASLNFIGLVQGKVREEHSDMVKKLTGMPDGFIHTCMQEKAYSHALHDFESYQKWRQDRNPKRAVMEAKVGYCVKHAVHLVRLMRMAIEILETGQVNVYRHDKDELIEIRRGAWKYDELESYADDLKHKAQIASDNSTLQKKPPVDKIESIAIKIVQTYLSKDEQEEKPIFQKSLH